MNYSCKLCGHERHELYYSGMIRNGATGTIKGEIIKCNECQVVRLEEEYCLKDADYEDNRYREELGQTFSLENYKAQHNHAHNQLHTELTHLNVIFDDKFAVDLGCGGGSFLDRYEDRCSKIVRIEPNEEFKSLLNRHQKTCYGSVKEFCEKEKNKADLVLANQVIEHVDDPRQFLFECASVIKKDGILIVSTPNLSEILLQNNNEKFKQHFFRKQHRWYFDIEILSDLIVEQFKEVLHAKSFHRYGFENFLRWQNPGYKENMLTDHDRYQIFDSLWKDMLSDVGFGDNLIVVARK